MWWSIDHKIIIKCNSTIVHTQHNSLKTNEQNTSVNITLNTHNINSNILPQQEKNAKFQLAF